MNVSIADIHQIPLCWANELADSLDPDGDLWRCGYDAYAIIRANWPECREEVEAMLTDLLTLENHYG